MENWLRRMQHPVGVVVAWGIGWFGVGAVIEAIYEFVPSFWFGGLMDIWPNTLAIAGLIVGVLFVLILRVAERRISFAEIPLIRLAGWGLLSGLLFGAALYTRAPETGAYAADAVRVGVAIVLPTALSTLSGPALRFAIHLLRSFAASDAARAQSEQLQ